MGVAKVGVIHGERLHKTWVANVEPVVVVAARGVGYAVICGGS